MKKLKSIKVLHILKLVKMKEAHMKKFAPKGRVVEYERGYVQTRI